MDFSLRAWEYTDGPALVRAADNKEIAKWLTDLFPHPYTEKDALSFITACRNMPETAQMNRAIVIDGNAAGSVSLSFASDIRTGTAELGYWLSEDYWGQGIMTEAVRRLLAEALSSVPLRRIEAHIFAGNGRSAQVLLNNGFHLESVLEKAIIKYGVVQDEELYVLLPGDQRKK